MVISAEPPRSSLRCAVVLISMLSHVIAVAPDSGASHLGAASQLHEMKSAWRHFQTHPHAHQAVRGHESLHGEFHGRLELEERSVKRRAGWERKRKARFQEQLRHDVEPHHSDKLSLERLNSEAVEHTHKLRLKSARMSMRNMARERNAKEEKTMNTFIKHVQSVKPDHEKMHKKQEEQEEHRFQKEAKEGNAKLKARAAVEKTGKFIEHQSAVHTEKHAKKEHRLEGLREIHVKNELRKSTPKPLSPESALATAEEQIAREASSSIATTLHHKEGLLKHKEAAMRRAKAMKEMRRMEEAADNREHNRKQTMKRERHRETEHKHMRKLARKSMAAALYKAPQAAKLSKTLEKDLHVLPTNSNPLPPLSSVGPSPSPTPPKSSTPPPPPTTTTNKSVAPKPSKGKPQAKPAAGKNTKHEHSGPSMSITEQMKPYIPLWIFLGFTCLACVLGAIVYKYRSGEVGNSWGEGGKGHWTNNSPGL